MSALDISICIVTLQARDYLRDCLNSLNSDCSLYSREIIVVDNRSEDGTIDMLRQDFQSVIVIENDGNEGFVRPMNQAMLAANGRYILLLNPDTIIPPRAVDTLVKFMEEHPEAGVCGPKVLNEDGTLQKPCRRGEPTPLAVVSYFTGLDRLFPRQKLFGGYLLGYLDEDQINPVGGVSGSCMLIRREVIDNIGYLDERFFAYQEDADFCCRTRQAGWKVYYVPTAKITHYGGRGGSRVQPVRAITAWHLSYLAYYRKHLASHYLFLFNWLYYGLIFIKLAFSLISNALRKEKYAGPKR
jgi:GT2 family glycosyltransferase